MNEYTCSYISNIILIIIVVCTSSHNNMYVYVCMHMHVYMHACVCQPAYVCFLSLYIYYSFFACVQLSIFNNC